MAENNNVRPPMGGMRRGAGKVVEKPKDFKGTTKKLLKNYIARYKLPVIIVILFAIGSTIFTIVGPKILGNATTEIFNGIVNKISGGAGIDFEKIATILLSLLGLYTLSAAFSLVQGFTMTTVTQKITYRMRNDLAHKINKLPMKYFDGKTHGEVLSIITNDIDMLSQNLNHSVTQIITAVCTVIGILVMMFSISWIMTLVSLIILPVTALLVGSIVKHSQKYFKAQQDYLGHVNGQVEEVYGGHNIVKVFNGEEKVTNTFKEANNVLYKSAWKSQFLSGLMFPVTNFIGNVGYVAVAILGGYLTIQGKIAVGDIQSFIQYNRQFVQPITQIAQISNTLQSMIAAAERVFEFLEEPEEVETTKGNIDIEKLKGNVEFNHVNFGYNPEKTIINDFSAQVKDGQKIAIVGPTGAGKTTMVKLLMRFYDVNSGSISIDGHNIKDFDRGNLRKMFGMVLQDTWLFSGTVEDNIKYGNPNATDSEVIEAAQAAHVHHFIKTLPKGYKSDLNEETSNVSAGQKQLLTIARVILANPKILILDEATSSIDTRTEQQIQAAMDNLMKGRTSFIIAHRLSTIKNADLILVMNHGDIVEQGTHDELLAKDGFYAGLYNSQFDVEEEA
ncbi:MAG TPA: ABC transporter ATP-binding protein [Candidatus Merdicola faecigallinarum]|uniref:ABC transporter ATP-binding protein n=1 Tax=Candidatus Merdicola faecigallinarum TaxID=2840862 RepID=A0A9D1LZK4_9FIRM|nr:ABC transporter ATP-binding protein [Candidatus Merdicola faecigallinarum]